MMIDLINFLHNYRPQPVIIKLGPIFVYWYGLLVVMGIVLGFIVVWRLIKKYQLKLTIDQLTTLSICLFLFGFLGARIYHILSEISYYQRYPIQALFFWQGGLGIFGALIAGIICIYFYAKKNQLSFWLILDLLAPAILLGEAIGRWGNWFNQENFGSPTSLIWGIPIDQINRPLEYLSNNYFHPTFLYQFIWNLIVFVFLLWLIRYIRLGSGKVFAWYLILYSLGRFSIEFLRINYQPMLLGLRLAQIVVLVLLVIGFLIIFVKRKNNLLTGN